MEPGLVLPHTGGKAFLQIVPGLKGLIQMSVERKDTCLALQTYWEASTSTLYGDILNYKTSVWEVFVLRCKKWEIHASLTKVRWQISVLCNLNS